MRPYSKESIVYPEPPSAPNGAASTPGRQQPAPHIPAPTPRQAPEMPSIDATQVRIDDVLDVSPEAPQFIVGEIIPDGTVTLLGSHGGVGKSMQALIIAICVAMGIDCLGKPTRQCRTAFYSSEDSASILRHRAGKICRRLGVDPHALAEYLFILDATDTEPLFHEVSEQGCKRGAVTPAYQALRQFVDEHGIEFAVIDNASDVYDANENERVRVRQFIRSLAKLVKERGGAVLLAAHIDKATARAGAGSGQGYSGSTQWHNSVRSRLFMLETALGVTLTHEKSNHGKKAAPQNLIWDDGVLMLDDTSAGSFLNTFIPASSTAAVLSLIDEFYSRGEFISPAPTSPETAYKKLSQESGFPENMEKEKLTALMRKAERDGQLKRETYKNPERKTKERWALTPAGKEQFAPACARYAPT